MKMILQNSFYEYTIGISDEGKLFHCAFLPKGVINDKAPEEWYNRFPYPYPFEAQVNINFEPLRISHGVRSFCSECTARAVYEGMEMKALPGGKLTIITLKDPVSELIIELHYEVYDDSPAIRRHTEVYNASRTDITINHIASFMVSNFPYFEDDCRSTYLHRFRSQWSYEGEHEIDSFAQIGLYGRNCRNGFTIESTGTWVCQEYIPYFVVEQRNAGLFTAVQNEYSSSWRFEVGAGECGFDNFFYMQGGMGNDHHAHWDKELAPGERFISPCASLTVAQGNVENAFNNMHLHQQRHLIHRSEADKSFPVIYNDWPFMQADVTEEKILEQLDILADCGMEIYVTDAGWFTEPAGRGGRSSWWTMAGHWDYDRERFPHGLKYVTDEIKKRGMKAGIWCEIEAVGCEAEIFNDPEMLLMREGRFVMDAGRRFLNFTSEKARNYAEEVFQKLIDWGFEYVKIDYNIDSAPGADNCGAENIGQGLHLNRMAYYDFLDTIRSRYPGLIIENCSSGGMRLEYGMLSRTDMASITDQGDYKLIGELYYNVSKLIHPSQCGVWSWQEDRLDEREYAFALTNSMAGRMHLSGNITRHDQNRTNMLRHAVTLYKKYRSIFEKCRTIHHCGNNTYERNDRIRALEIRAEDNSSTLISVQRPETSDNLAVIPIIELEPGSYMLEHFPSGEMKMMTHEELEKGLNVVLSKPFSAEIIYIYKAE